jgi:rhodanese-related sulfurtransferase
VHPFGPGRVEPSSQPSHPAITNWDQQIILGCQERFQSSLAAASLHQPGLVNATDLDGGFAAWTAAGLPVMPAAA